MPTVEFVVPKFTFAVPTIVIPTIPPPLDIDVVPKFTFTVPTIVIPTIPPPLDIDLDAILATSTARLTATPESVLVEATGTVRVTEPTVVTSDRRCLAGIEPLAMDIWQTIDDGRYLTQTYIEAWETDEGTWGGENPELDEFLEGMMSNLADVIADGQEDAWTQGVQELYLKIAGMWQDLSEGQSEPVAQLLVAMADAWVASALPIDCGFGDYECMIRRIMTEAESMAKAYRDLAAAGEDCPGFAALSERLRNLADISLSTASEFAEQVPR